MFPFELSIYGSGILFVNSMFPSASVSSHDSSELHKCATTPAPIESPGKIGEKIQYIKMKRQQYLYEKYTPNVDGCSKSIQKPVYGIYQ